jgi:hypothetical protein
MGWSLLRVFEPSAIRRGQRQASPVWRVVDADTGESWRFARKRDALKFLHDGGCTVHVDSVWECDHCHGRRLLAASLPSDPPMPQPAKSDAEPK